MKRIALIMAIVLLASFVLCACSAENDASNNVIIEVDTGDTELPSPSPASTEEIDIGAVADIQVEQNLFNVEFTVPADLLDEGLTQADYDARAKDAGWKSATLNADGSVTYVMTKAQHNEMMREMRDTIDAELASLAGSEEYPNFVSVSPNADYTEYTIVTKSESVNMMEAMSVLMFYMYGGMYSAFNGTPADNIHVEFVNEATGEVIQEADSASTD